MSARTGHNIAYDLRPGDLVYDTLYDIIIFVISVRHYSHLSGKPHVSHGATHVYYEYIICGSEETFTEMSRYTTVNSYGFSDGGSGIHTKEFEILSRLKK
jgi:hypothetical protein